MTFSTNTEVQDSVANAINKTEDNEMNTDNLSLESLVLLINTERLKTLQEKSLKEFTELKERQQQVSELHDLLKALNKATDDKGVLEIGENEELTQLLEKSKELGIEVEDGKTSYNREERERLVENVRMSIEDLNVQNDMQLQTISRLTNDRYESYQMARSILKPLHEAKTSLARSLRGA